MDVVLARETKLQAKRDGVLQDLEKTPLVCDLHDKIKSLEVQLKVRQTDYGSLKAPSSTKKSSPMKPPSPGQEKHVSHAPAPEKPALPAKIEDCRVVRIGSGEPTELEGPFVMASTKSVFYSLNDVSIGDLYFTVSLMMVNGCERLSSNLCRRLGRFLRIHPIHI
ncbi:hypothetical protein Tco_1056677 [Tanacetum coccineum]|uniref:Ternary complex factor MIP1 leucine-zipper domain-containing protein n=1 Tax=Tanacetum coccineum TaxID=301880 RepID=A0ABQ5H4P6_9ASTR